MRREVEVEGMGAEVSETTEIPVIGFLLDIMPVVVRLNSGASVPLDYRENEVMSARTSTR